MKRHVKWLLLALSFACLAGTAGCGSSEEVTADSFSTEEEVIPEEVEAEEPEEEEVEEVAPEGMYRSELTNEWISEDLKDQRPIAVMVDNEKTALPHYGLS